MQQLSPTTQYNKFRDFSDLYIVSCGTEGMNPEHSFGPLVFNDYVFQYVVYGAGKYKIGNNVYDLHRGDLFFIPKGSSVYYESNSSTPYSYFWVVFNGAMAEKLLALTPLSQNTPVVFYNDDSIAFIMDKIVNDIAVKTQSAAINATGELYKLFPLLAKKCTLKEIQRNQDRSRYVYEAMFYIHDYYYKPLTIDDIAKHVGLNRSYFSTLFKKQCSATPLEYLISIRMKEACRLLKETDYPVSEIAAIVGFESAVNFYIRFKQKLGISPKEYRKTEKNKQK